MTTYLDIVEKVSMGGVWLAAARRWMQSNIRNGDRLTWGSDELVQVPFCKLEDLAKEVAIALLLEDVAQKGEKQEIEEAVDVATGSQREILAVRRYKGLYDGT